MKLRYQQEFNLWQRIIAMLTTMWRINEDSIDFKWGYFSPSFGLTLMFHRGGYFDSNYAISFCFIWGSFHIKLPIKTRLAEGCDLPRYGFTIFDNTLMMYWGGKYDSSIGQTQSRMKSWDLPLVSYVFEYHRVLNKQGTWEDGTASYDNQNIDRADYPYTYRLKSGEVQEVTATCFIEQRQWHRKWLPFIKLRKTSLSIEFSEEVGERRGSWKGGVLGCGYAMLPNETREECLLRMERERKFN